MFNLFYNYFTTLVFIFAYKIICTGDKTSKKLCINFKHKYNLASIECFQQSAISGVAYNLYNNMFGCQPTVSQCYKYVCTGNGSP